LALVRAVLPSASSLPGVVSELLRDRADNAGLTADGPNNAIARAEAFLRTGEPAGDGAILRVAVRDGVSFAALLRRLARSVPSGIDRLADRLLDWLLAEEVAASLAPDLSVDLPESAAAWRRTFRALLAGETLPPATGTGLHLDRLAALRHWLDHGVLPPWTPAGLGAKALADLSVFDLRALFAGTDVERASVRLRRVMDDLGETAGSALLVRLAPAVFTADSTLATILRNAEPGAHGDIRLRAVAAAVTEAALDPAWLARPVPRVRPSQGVQHTEPPQPEDRTEVLAWLEGAGHLLPARQIRLLASLADAGDPALDAALRTGLARPAARDRWVQALPQEVLGRLLQSIVPTRARLLLTAMAVLTAAWRQAMSTASAPPAWPWSKLLALLAEPGSHPPRRLVARLAETLAPAGANAQARLLRQARAIAQSAGLAGIVPAFRPPDIHPGPPAGPPVVPAPRIESDTAHYVGNAGLILFAPFLPTFFTRLGLLSQVSGKQRIAGLEAASRAVHLLQFLVDQRCDRPEHTLLLNKLLCGISWAEPILPMIEPTKAEAGLCSEVTRALIGNWTAVRNAAPEGVRETFLQRDGRLTHGADRWDLQVQRKTVDVLTDLIPWNRSIIYHPWMAEAVYVTW
jgi:hypothetical protein